MHAMRAGVCVFFIFCTSLYYIVHDENISEFAKARNEFQQIRLLFIIKIRLNSTFICTIFFSIQTRALL